MPSKQTFAAFCFGAITAVAALFLLSAQYSDYRRSAEMKQEIQRLAPLQEQLAAELADGGIKSSLQTVRQDYPSVQSVSRDGWILLRTPRFGQEAKASAGRCITTIRTRQSTARCSVFERGFQQNDWRGIAKEQAALNAPKAACTFQPIMKGNHYDRHHTHNCTPQPFIGIGSHAHRLCQPYLRRYLGYSRRSQ